MKNVNFQPLYKQHNTVNLTEINISLLVTCDILLYDSEFG